MTDDKINFETAKLAKEKGFDELCNTSFNTLGKSSSFTGYDHMKGYNKNSMIHLVDTNTEEFEYPNLECVRPTQSLLQKWLREIHNIHVSCHPTFTNKMWYPKAVNLDNPNDDLLAGRIFDYHKKTHEAGFELGLFETLKLYIK